MKKMRKKVEIIRLEERVLFDAAAAAAVVEAAEQQNDIQQEQQQEQQKQQQEQQVQAQQENVEIASVQNDGNGDVQAESAYTPEDNGAADDGAEHSNVGEAVDAMSDTDDVNSDEISDVSDADALQESIDAAVAENTDAAIEALINGDDAEESEDAIAPAADEADAVSSISAQDDNADTLAEEAAGLAPDAENTVEDNGHHELAIISNTVPDQDSLISQLAEGTDVLVLDDSSDVLDQINEYLDGQDYKYDAIHVLSHGGNGYLILNHTVIDMNTLADDPASFAALGEHLTADGDILLYGCNVASGEDGQAFASQLASLTGADVAASMDNTGIGNWTLEYTIGAVENHAFILDQYDYVLANYNIGTGAEYSNFAEAWNNEATHATGSTFTYISDMSDSFNFTGAAADAEYTIIVQSGVYLTVEGLVVPSGVTVTGDGPVTVNIGNNSFADVFNVFHDSGTTYNYDVEKTEAETITIGSKYSGNSYTFAGTFSNITTDIADDVNVTVNIGENTFNDVFGVFHDSGTTYIYNVDKTGETGESIAIGSGYAQNSYTITIDSGVTVDVSTYDVHAMVEVKVDGGALNLGTSTAALDDTHYIDVAGCSYTVTHGGVLNMYLTSGDSSGKSAEVNSDVSVTRGTFNFNGGSNNAFNGAIWGNNSAVGLATDDTIINLSGSAAFSNTVCIGAKGGTLNINGTSGQGISFSHDVTTAGGWYTINGYMREDDSSFASSYPTNQLGASWVDSGDSSAQGEGSALVHYDVVNDTTTDYYNGTIEVKGKVQFYHPVVSTGTFNILQQDVSNANATSVTFAEGANNFVAVDGGTFNIGTTDTSNEAITVLFNSTLYVTPSYNGRDVTFNINNGTVTFNSDVYNMVRTWRGDNTYSSTKQHQVSNVDLRHYTGSDNKDCLGLYTLHNTSTTFNIGAGATLVEFNNGTLFNYGTFGVATVMVNKDQVSFNKVENVAYGVGVDTTASTQNSLTWNSDFIKIYGHNGTNPGGTASPVTADGWYKGTLSGSTLNGAVFLVNSDGNIFKGSVANIGGNANTEQFSGYTPHVGNAGFYISAGSTGNAFNGDFYNLSSSLFSIAESSESNTFAGTLNNSTGTFVTGLTSTINTRLQIAGQSHSFYQIDNNGTANFNNIANTQLNFVNEKAGMATFTGNCSNVKFVNLSADKPGLNLKGGTVNINTDFVTEIDTTISIASGASLTFNARNTLKGAIYNAGTFAVASSDTVKNADGARFIIDSTITNGKDSSGKVVNEKAQFNVNGYTQFSKTGTITNLANFNIGVDGMAFDALFTNNKTLNIGRVVEFANLTNSESGTVFVGSGSEYSVFRNLNNSGKFSVGTSDILFADSLNNSGTLSINSGVSGVRFRNMVNSQGELTFLNSGTLQLNGRFDQENTISVHNQTDGKIKVDSVVYFGKVQNDADGAITVSKSGNNSHFYGTLVNDGEIGGEGSLFLDYAVSGSGIFNMAKGSSVTYNYARTAVGNSGYDADGFMQIGGELVYTITQQSTAAALDHYTNRPVFNAETQAWEITEITEEGTTVYTLAEARNSNYIASVDAAGNWSVGGVSKWIAAESTDKVSRSAIERSTDWSIVDPSPALNPDAVWQENSSGTAVNLYRNYDLTNALKVELSQSLFGGTVGNLTLSGYATLSDITSTVSPNSLVVGVALGNGLTLDITDDFDIRGMRLQLSAGTGINPTTLNINGTYLDSTVSSLVLGNNSLMQFNVSAESGQQAAAELNGDVWNDGTIGITENARLTFNRETSYIAAAGRVAGGTNSTVVYNEQAAEIYGGMYSNLVLANTGTALNRSLRSDLTAGSIVAPEQLTVYDEAVLMVLQSVSGNGTFIFDGTSKGVFESTGSGYTIAGITVESTARGVEISGFDSSNKITVSNLINNKSSDKRDIPDGYFGVTAANATFGTVTNNGEFTIGNDVYFTGTFTNNAADSATKLAAGSVTINQDADKSTTLTGAAFNGGTLELQSGTLTIENGTWNGSVTTKADTMLNLSNTGTGTLSFYNIDLSGVLNSNGNIAIGSAEAETVGLNMQNTGTLTVERGNLTIYYFYSADEMASEYPIQIQSDATLTLAVENTSSVSVGIENIGGTLTDTNTRHTGDSRDWIVIDNLGDTTSAHSSVVTNQYYFLVTSTGELEVDQKGVSGYSFKVEAGGQLNFTLDDGETETAKAITVQSAEFADGSTFSMADNVNITFDGDFTYTDTDPDNRLTVSQGSTVTFNGEIISLAEEAASAATITAGTGSTVVYGKTNATAFSGNYQDLQITGENVTIADLVLAGNLFGTGSLTITGNADGEGTVGKLGDASKVSVSYSENTSKVYGVTKNTEQEMVGSYGKLTLIGEHTLEADIQTDVLAAVRPTGSSAIFNITVANGNNLTIGGTEGTEVGHIIAAGTSTTVTYAGNDVTKLFSGNYNKLTLSGVTKSSIGNLNLSGTLTLENSSLTINGLSKADGKVTVNDGTGTVSTLIYGPGVSTVLEGAYGNLEILTGESTAAGEFTVGGYFRLEGTLLGSGDVTLNSITKGSGSFGSSAKHYTGTVTYADTADYNAATHISSVFGGYYEDLVLSGGNKYSAAALNAAQMGLKLSAGKTLTIEQGNFTVDKFTGTPAGTVVLSNKTVFSAAGNTLPVFNVGKGTTLNLSGDKVVLNDGFIHGTLTVQENAAVMAVGIDLDKATLSVGNSGKLTISESTDTVQNLSGITLADYAVLTLVKGSYAVSGNVNTANSSLLQLGDVLTAPTTAATLKFNGSSNSLGAVIISGTESGVRSALTIDGTGETTINTLSLYGNLNVDSGLLNLYYIPASGYANLNVSDGAELHFNIYKSAENPEKQTIYATLQTGREAIVSYDTDLLATAAQYIKFEPGGGYWQKAGSQTFNLSKYNSDRTKIGLVFANNNSTWSEYTVYLDDSTINLSDIVIEDGVTVKFVNKAGAEVKTVSSSGAITNHGTISVGDGITLTLAGDLYTDSSRYNSTVSPESYTMGTVTAANATVVYSGVDSAGASGQTHIFSGTYGTLTVDNDREVWTGTNTLTVKTALKGTGTLTIPAYMTLEGTGEAKNFNALTFNENSVGSIGGSFTTITVTGNHTFTSGSITAGTLNFGKDAEGSVVEGTLTLQKDVTLEVSGMEKHTGITINGESGSVYTSRVGDLLDGKYDTLNLYKSVEVDTLEVAKSLNLYGVTLTVNESATLNGQINAKTQINAETGLNILTFAADATTAGNAAVSLAEGATLTANYGDSATTIYTGTYTDLKLGNGAYEINGSGNLTVGGTLYFGNAESLTGFGDWDFNMISGGNETEITNSGTVKYSSGGNKILAGTYNNLAVNEGGKSPQTYTVGAVQIDGTISGVATLQFNDQTSGTGKISSDSATEISAEYSAASGVVYGGTYQNLTFVGVRTLNDDLNVVDTFTMKKDATGASSLTGSGDWTFRKVAAESFSTIANTGTVTYEGTYGDTILSGVYNDVYVEGSRSVGNFTLNGTLSGNGTITFNGTTTAGTTGTPKVTGISAVYNEPAATVFAGEYGSLTLQGSKTLSGDITVSGNLTGKRTEAGATSVISGSGTLTVDGKLVGFGDEQTETFNRNAVFNYSGDITVGGSDYAIKGSTFNGKVTLNGDSITLKDDTFGGKVTLNGDAIMLYDDTFNGELVVNGSDVSLWGTNDKGTFLNGEVSGKGSMHLYDSVSGTGSFKMTGGTVTYGVKVGSVLPGYYYNLTLEGGEILNSRTISNSIEVSQSFDMSTVKKLTIKEGGSLLALEWNSGSGTITVDEGALLEFGSRYYRPLPSGAPYQPSSAQNINAAIVNNGTLTVSRGSTKEGEGFYTFASVTNNGTFYVDSDPDVAKVVLTKFQNNADATALFHAPTIISELATAEGWTNYGNLMMNNFDNFGFEEGSKLHITVGNNALLVLGNSTYTFDAENTRLTLGGSITSNNAAVTFKAVEEIVGNKNYITTDNGKIYFEFKQSDWGTASEGLYGYIDNKSGEIYFSTANQNYYGKVTNSGGDIFINARSIFKDSVSTDIFKGSDGKTHTIQVNAADTIFVGTVYTGSCFEINADNVTFEDDVTAIHDFVIAENMTTNFKQNVKVFSGSGNNGDTVFTVSKGAKMKVGGTFTNQGTDSTGGWYSQVNLYGTAEFKGTLTNSSTSASNAAEFVVYSTSTGNVFLDISNSGSGAIFRMNGANNSFNGTISNTGNFYVNAANNFGDFTNSGSGYLWINYEGSNSRFGKVDNSGTVTVRSSLKDEQKNRIYFDGMLTNSGVFNLETPGVNFLGGITNSGLFNITAPTGWKKIPDYTFDSAVANSGQFNVNVKSLFHDEIVNSGTFKASEQIKVVGYSIINEKAGKFILDAADNTFADSSIINRGTFNINAANDLRSIVFSNESGELIVAGDIVEFGTVFNYADATITVTGKDDRFGSVVNNGTLVLKGVDTEINTLTSTGMVDVFGSAKADTLNLFYDGSSMSKVYIENGAELSLTKINAPADFTQSQFTIAGSGTLNANYGGPDEVIVNSTIIFVNGASTDNIVNAGFTKFTYLGGEAWIVISTDTVLTETETTLPRWFKIMSGATLTVKSASTTSAFWVTSGGKLVLDNADAQSGEARITKGGEVGNMFVDNGGSVTINALNKDFTTAVYNSGTITVNGMGAKFTGTLTNDGTLNLNYSAAGTIVNNKTVNVTGADVTVGTGFTNSSKGTLAIKSTGAVLGGMVNEGAISIAAGAEAELNGLTNSGTITIAKDGKASLAAMTEGTAASGKMLSTIKNSGTLSVSASEVKSNIENSGTITLVNASTFSGSVTANSGSVFNGAELTFAGKTTGSGVTFDNDVKYTGENATIIGGTYNAKLIAGNNLTISSDLTVGTLDFEEGYTVTVSAKLTLADHLAGNETNALFVAETGSVLFNGDVVSNTASIVNEGSVTVNGYSNSFATVLNSGKFTVSSEANSFSDLTNNGTLNLANSVTGAILNNKTVNVTGEAVTIGAGFVNSKDGTVSVSGSAVFDGLSNSGVITISTSGKALLNSMTEETAASGKMLSTIKNSGTLSVSASEVKSNIENSGTITLVGASTFSGSMTANSGSVFNGSMLTLSGKTTGSGVTFDNDVKYTGENATIIGGTYNAKLIAGNNLTISSDLTVATLDFVGSNTVTVNVQLTLTDHLAGSAANTLAVSSTGSVLFNGDIVSNTAAVVNRGNITVNGYNNSFANLTNSGTFKVGKGGLVELTNLSEISGSASAYTTEAGGTLTFNISSGSVLTDGISGNLTNAGTMNLNTVGMYYAGTVSNSGKAGSEAVFNVNAQSIFEGQISRNSYGTITVAETAAGTVFQNTVNASSDFIINGSVVFERAVTVSGEFTVNAASLFYDTVKINVSDSSVRNTAFNANAGIVFSKDVTITNSASDTAWNAVVNINGIARFNGSLTIDAQNGATHKAQLFINADNVTFNEVNILGNGAEFVVNGSNNSFLGKVYNGKTTETTDEKGEVTTTTVGGGLFELNGVNHIGEMDNIGTAYFRINNGASGSSIGKLTNSGRVAIYAGINDAGEAVATAFAFNDTVENQKNGTFSINSEKVTFNREITNAGIFNVNAALAFSKELTNSGTFNINGGNSSFSGSITNTGTLTVAQDVKGVQFTGTFTNKEKGILALGGEDTVMSKVVNSGTIRVTGGLDNSEDTPGNKINNLTMDSLVQATLNVSATGELTLVTVNDNYHGTVSQDDYWLVTTTVVDKETTVTERRMTDAEIEAYKSGEGTFPPEDTETTSYKVDKRIKYEDGIQGKMNVADGGVLRFDPSVDQTVYSSISVTGDSDVMYDPDKTKFESLNYLDWTMVYGGTISGYGRYRIMSGASVSVSGDTAGSFFRVMEGGSLTLNNVSNVSSLVNRGGSVNVNGGIYSITLENEYGSMTVSSGTFSADTDVNNADEGSLVVSGANLTLDVANNGFMQITGSNNHIGGTNSTIVTVSGNGNTVAMTNAGTLNMNANGTVGGTNEGIINVAAGKSVSFSAFTDTASAALVLNGTANFTDQTLNGSFTANGAKVNGNLTLKGATNGAGNTFNGNVAYSGTQSVIGGTYNGTLDAASATNAGVVTANGTVTLNTNSGTVNASGNAFITANDGTVNANGNNRSVSVTSNRGNITVAGSNVELNGHNYNTVDVEGSAKYNMVSEDTAKVNVNGAVTISDAAAFSGVITNNGTVNLDTVIADGTIINKGTVNANVDYAADAIFSKVAVNGGAVNLNAAADLTGKVIVSGANVNINSGTVVIGNAVNNGTLAFNYDGYTLNGDIAGAGTTVANAVLNLDGGKFSGSYQVNGMLNLIADRSELAGTIVNNSMIAAHSVAFTGVNSGAGTVDADSAVYSGKATFLFGGAYDALTVDNNGTLAASAEVGDLMLNGTLATASGANLVLNGATEGSGTMAGGAGIVTYNKAGQSVYGGTYHNVVFNKAVNPIDTIEITGNAVNNSGIQLAAADVTYSGSSEQQVMAADYTTLELKGRGIKRMESNGDFNITNFNINPGTTNGSYVEVTGSGNGRWNLDAANVDIHTAKLSDVNAARTYCLDGTNFQGTNNSANWLVFYSGSNVGETAPTMENANFNALSQYFYQTRMAQMNAHELLSRHTQMESAKNVNVRDMVVGDDISLNESYDIVDFNRDGWNGIKLADDEVGEVLNSADVVSDSFDEALAELLK